MEDELKNQILGTRRMSPDNTVVTYDLTSGVDFKHPRKTAEALSEVFFETDASKWFKTTENSVEFQPRYKTQIIVTVKDNQLFEETLSDFMEDLKKNEISEKYGNQIYENINYQVGLGTVFVAGLLGAAIIQAHGQSVQRKEYVQKLLDDIKENTEIKTIS